MQDSRGNEISRTIYESLLSQAIIESRCLYRDLFLQINAAIQQFITTHQNSEANKRELFAIFSLLNSEFAGYDKIETLLQPDFDIFAVATFHKLYFQYLLQHIISRDLKTSKNSLFSTVQGYISSQVPLLKALDKSLNNHSFFEDKKAGRQSKELDQVATHKFGITTEQYAVGKLSCYFKVGYFSGQLKFEPNKESLAFKWLAQNKQPFIAGISSTIGTCYSALIYLGFSREQIKLYLMVLTATLVARGHHSFGETHLVWKKIGIPLENKENMQEYYEQFLTKEFIASDRYKNLSSEIRQHLQQINCLMIQQ